MVYKTLNIKDQITDGENRSNINGKQQIQNVNKTIFLKRHIATGCHGSKNSNLSKSKVNLLSN